MARTYLSVVYVFIFFASITLHSVHGKCSVVSCLVGMIRCTRKADASGEDYETFGCCDPYFECMRGCGMEPSL